MAAIFLDDLTDATEIVITPRNKVRPNEPGLRARSELGSGTRALKDATRRGSVLGAAVRGHRTLEPRESWSVAVLAAALLALALVAVLLPRLIAFPIAVLSGVTGGLLLLKALRLSRNRSPQEAGASDRG